MLQASFEDRVTVYYDIMRQHGKVIASFLKFCSQFLYPISGKGKSMIESDCSYRLLVSQYRKLAWKHSTLYKNHASIRTLKKTSCESQYE